jgi:hypothetical protein
MTGNQILLIMFKKLLNFFHIPKWLFFLLLLVIVLRIPNFFEPYSYGDETIYLTLGEGIRKGVTLYKNLHDNKPPLLYITAAVAGNLFWFKTILLFSSLLCITLFFRFSEKLYPKIKHFAVISTIIFSLLTTLPFFEGNIVNAENFMLIPTIAAFYILLFKKSSSKYIFISGLLFSISSLYKIPAIFDFPAIILFWLISSKLSKKGFYEILSKTFFLLLGIATPILFTFIYYFLKGAFSDYLIAAYLQNFGYLSSWRPDSNKDPFLVKNAPLIIRGIVVFAINVLLYLSRKRVDKKFLFLVSWLSFSIFAVTLSERPYPHYLLQSAATISALIGLLFTSVSMLQVYSVFPVTLFLLIPLVYRFWHYRSADYYLKFINFSGGRLGKTQYLGSFGGRTITNYEISGIIKGLTKENDRVFIWEDSAQIYALSKRLPPIKYTSGYHINDFSSIDNAVSQLQKNPPKVVVVFFSSKPPPELLVFIRNNYILYKETGEYQIWKYGGEYSRYVY